MLDCKYYKDLIRLIWLIIAPTHDIISLNTTTLDTVHKAHIGVSVCHHISVLHNVNIVTLVLEKNIFPNFNFIK